MSGHTEGPWTWSHGAIESTLYGKDDGYTVEILEGVYFPDENEFTDENRALISAAPDMLEALEDAPITSKYHGKNGFETERFLADYQDWRTKRNAAISKATLTRNEGEVG